MVFMHFHHNITKAPILYASLFYYPTKAGRHKMDIDVGRVSYLPWAAAAAVALEGGVNN